MASASTKFGRVIACSRAPYLFIIAGVWWRAMSSSSTRADSRAGAVVVGRGGAAEGQLEVHVHVEHAGNDVMAPGVDDLLRVVQVGAERGDLLAGDAHIAGERSGGSHDIPALDDLIESH